MQGERYGISKPNASWHQKALDFSNQLSAGIYCRYELWTIAAFEIIGSDSGISDNKQTALSSVGQCLAAVTMAALIGKMFLR